MKFVLPCLLFLSFPAYADDVAPVNEIPVNETLCAHETACTEGKTSSGEQGKCFEQEPCEVMQEIDGAASRVEVVTPDDAPEGYDEQIYIME